MAEKQQQPGGFYPPNSGMPSAPPSYQETFGYQNPSHPTPGQAPSPYGAQYPTASGAPAYYQQTQQAQAPYPNYGQPYAGAPAYNVQMVPQQQPPVNVASPYPKASGPMAYPTGPVAAAGGQFDAGARFSPYAPPSVPPPPPGCAPNTAQMAAAQGQTVVTTKKKGGFWNGSGSGGYTFW